MFMATEHPGHRGSFGTRSSDLDLGSLGVTSSDRILVPSVESNEASTRGKKWSLHVLILYAYFGPALAILLPFPNPAVRLAGVVISGIGAALFALVCLDRNNPHRLRLFIAGAGVAVAFLYVSVKPWLGL